MRSIEHLLSSLTSEAFSKKGSALARLMGDWHLIVGEDVARVTSPKKLSFASKKVQSGTLQVAVLPEAVLEIQYQTEEMIQAVNQHMGQPLINKITLQKTVLAGSPEPKPSFFEMREPERTKFEVEGIEDDALSKALENLGGK